jgi:hypothetical protein
VTDKAYNYAMVVVVTAPNADRAYDLLAEAAWKAEFIGDPWKVSQREDDDYTTADLVEKYLRTGIVRD